MSHEALVCLKGKNNLPQLTMPNSFIKIHEVYLGIGSDIIETNTFNGTAVSQGDYRFQEIVHQMSKIGTKLTKMDTAAMTKEEDPSRPRSVARAIGPTSRTVSALPRLEDC